jgi:acyl carrier protein
MPTYDEIFEKVQATLVDALGVDEEEVTREATLQGDLGAESIDFLDIVFRLERNFGIKIPRGELFPENLMADPEWVADGKLTPKGVGELKARLPFADLSKLEAIPPSTGSAIFTRSRCSFNMFRVSWPPKPRLRPCMIDFRIKPR